MGSVSVWLTAKWQGRNFSTLEMLKLCNNMKSFKRIGLRLGLTGLSIGLVLNLLAVFVFHRTSAHFFTSPWWNAWFPNYLVWFVFAIIGFASRKRV
jgi:hypothetical protein